MSTPPSILRAELAKKIADKLAGHLHDWHREDLETVAGSVLSVFHEFEDEVRENEVTSLADTHEQIIWTRWIEARCGIETGTYTGKRRI